MGSGCLERQGPGMQQGKGMAGVTPAGERVPRPGVLVGEAGLRPRAVTPRGSGSPLGAGPKGELRVPLGQKRGPRSPCMGLSITLLVRGPPGLPHPLPGTGTSVGHPPPLPSVWVPVRDPQPGAGSPPSTGASMGPQFQSRTPVVVWVSPSWYRCQHDTSLRESNPTDGMGAAVGPPTPVQDPIPALGSHPGTGARRGFPSQYWALIPVQVLTWGPHSGTGHLSPVASPHPSMGAGMGPPIPVQDTPSWYWVPIPVQVPVRELPSQYGTSQPSTGAGTGLPIPVWVLVQVPHACTGSTFQDRYRYGSPIAVRDTPCRYRVPIPVWDLPSRYGMLHASTRSPSRNGCRYGVSIPVWVLVQVPHAGTGPPSRDRGWYQVPPSRYRTSHAGTGSPSRYGYRYSISIPVRASPPRDRSQ